MWPFSKKKDPIITDLDRALSYERALVKHKTKIVDEHEEFCKRIVAWMVSKGVEERFIVSNRIEGTNDWQIVVTMDERTFSITIDEMADDEDTQGLFGKAAEIILIWEHFIEFKFDEKRSMEPDPKTKYGPKYK